MKSSKRIFSLFLALLMIASVFPLGVSAEEFAEVTPVAVETTATETAEAAPASVPSQTEVTPTMETLNFEDEPMAMADSDFSYVVQNDAAYITGVSNIQEVVEIPSQINNYPVVGITGLRDYSGKAKTLVIPDSVETISQYAISIPSLEVIQIGSGLKTASQEMFYDCRGVIWYEVSYLNPYLTSYDGVIFNEGMSTILVFPHSWEAPTYIVPATVSDADELFRILEQYDINIEVRFDEANVNFVEEDGVIYNANKTKVVLCKADKTGAYVMPDTVVEIADRAFANCTGLTEVTVSKNVTEITYCAFAGCSSLAAVTLPSGLKRIEDSAFGDCKSLSRLNLSDLSAWCAVYLQGSNAHPFSSSKNANEVYLNGSLITDLVIPEDVVTVSSHVFYNCNTFRSVLFPEGLENIGIEAFCCCTALESANLPSTLKTVQASAFYGDTLLDIENCTFPSGMESIGSCAFEKTGLTYVNLGEGDPYVYSSAFYDCDKLKTVVLGNNQTSYKFSSFVFCGCMALENVTFGSKMTYVPHYMFQVCTALENLVIPANITEIKTGAFSGCKKLDKVTVEGKLSYIGEYAFSGCLLTDMTFVGGVDVIGKHSFAEIGASSFVLPENVTDIGYEAFAGSANLGSLDIPETVVSMCGKTLDGTAWYEEQAEGVLYLEHVLMGYKGTMPANTHVDVQAGTRVIADWAFEEEYNLTSVTLPEGLITIGEFAFVRTGITDLTIPEGTKTIEALAFYESALQTISIPASLTSGLWSTFSYANDLISIEVDPDNPNYSSHSGVLYNKEGTQIVHNPIDRVEVISLPHKTEYAPGEEIDLSGGQVKLYNKNGESFLYDMSYGEASADLSQTGETSVTVSFGPYSFEYVVNVSPTLALSNAKAKFGEEIEVLLTLKGLPELRSFGFVDLSYDESKLELVSGQWLNEEDYAMADWSEDEGSAAAIYASGNHDMNGDVFKLVFRVLDDAEEGETLISLVPGANYSDYTSSPALDVPVEMDVVGGMVTIQNTVRGDVNGDEAVTSDDAVYLLYHTVFGSERYPVNQNCDFNGDGAVSAEDAVHLLYYTIFPDRYPI